MLYVCVLDTIYGLVTKKINNRWKFKEDNRNSKIQLRLSYKQ